MFFDQVDNVADEAGDDIDGDKEQNNPESEQKKEKDNENDETGQLEAVEIFQHKRLGFRIAYGGYHEKSDDQEKNRKKRAGDASGGKTERGEGNNDSGDRRGKTGEGSARRAPIQRPE